MSYPTNRIIVELSEEDRSNNHIPEETWLLSRNNEVWIKDKKTSEHIQILDCTEESKENL